MILYLDTSALVKLYVAEEGSGSVAEQVKMADIVATSRVAYVEANAGIARKHREGEFARADYARLLKTFEVDWENYFVIEMTADVARLGGELVQRHPLRGFDAIHLASALLLKRKTKMNVAFSCFDERLAQAAQAERLDR